MKSITLPYIPMIHPLPRSAGPAEAGLLLTETQLESWQTDGYVVVDGLLAEAELTAMEAFFEDFKRLGLPVFDGGQRFEEVDRHQRQVRAMHPHRHSARVLGWALHPSLMDVLEALMGRPALLAQTMYYFKPPGSKGQGMHQDDFYLQTKPASCVAAWVAIDDAEVENGCLYLVPGSQGAGIYCPKGEGAGWMEYGDSHIRPFPRQFRPVAVPVRRGQVLFFGGQLIHGSGPNRHPSRSRRTFIGHYVDNASSQVSAFYHPVLDRHGKVVSSLSTAAGGGPCGDGIGGGLH